MTLKHAIFEKYDFLKKKKTWHIKTSYNLIITFWSPKYRMFIKLNSGGIINDFCDFSLQFSTLKSNKLLPICISVQVQKIFFLRTHVIIIHVIM